MEIKLWALSLGFSLVSEKVRFIVRDKKQKTKKTGVSFRVLKRNRGFIFCFRLDSEAKIFFGGDGCWELLGTPGA